MVDEADNLMLRALRYISEQNDGIREDIREIKSRLSLIGQQYASVSRRVDRIELRLERIETRLDLVEA